MCAEEWAVFQKLLFGGLLGYLGSHWCSLGPLRGPYRINKAIICPGSASVSEYMVTIVPTPRVNTILQGSELIPLGKKWD